VAIWTGPHDAQDGGDEQDGAGYIGADKGDSEDRGQDRKGGRRAQGAGRRAQGAGRRAQGAGHGGMDSKVRRPTIEPVTLRGGAQRAHAPDAGPRSCVDRW